MRSPSFISAVMLFLLSSCGERFSITPTLIQNTDSCDISDYPFKGSGTSLSPYQICSVEHFIRLDTLLSNAVLAPNYADKHYKLLNDIDLTYEDTSWLPIGTVNTPLTAGERLDPYSITSNFTLSPATHPFRGIFDGNSKKISGARINRTGSDDFLGLFVQITGPAIIKDLILEDFEFILEDSIVVGTLAALITEDVQVTNVDIHSSIQVAQSGHLLGGVAGLVTSSDADALYSTFFNINYNGALEGPQTYTVIDPASATIHSSLIGGIAGVMVGSVVESAIVSGTVKGGDAVGGVLGVGITNLRLIDVRNDSQVTGLLNTAGIMGIFYGISGNFVSLKNHGSVQTQPLHDPADYTHPQLKGNLAGLIGNMSNPGMDPILVKDSDNYGIVSLQGNTLYGGGILAYADGLFQMQNVSNQGKLNSDVQGLNIGGVLGYSTSSHPVILSNVTNTAPIETGITSAFAIGGLAGYIGNGEINTCTNSGTIENLGLGDISGLVVMAGTLTIRDSINLGGLRGPNDIAGLIHSGVDVIIENSHVRSNMEGMVSSLNIGGIVAKVNDSLNISGSSYIGEIILTSTSNNARAGGLIAGIISSATVTIVDSYSQGKIINNDISQITGGILGQIDTASGNINFNRLYSSMDLLTADPAFGHFIGQYTVDSSMVLSPITCSDCYFVETSSGKPGTSGDAFSYTLVENTGSMPLTTMITPSDLTAETSFPGMDFLGTWEMGTEGPRLQGENGLIP